MTELVQGILGALPRRREESRRAGNLWKRPLDVSLGLTLFLLSLPLLVLVIVAVWFQDRGPILHRQVRVGTGGRRFECLKVRTMACDAEARLRRDARLFERYVKNGFKLPAEDDPRITRIGRIIRTTSLDELPQLVNVLRGDMSLVGPRPVVEPELEEYRARGCAAAYLSARPGLTGLWQVSGRSDLGYDDRVALDMNYLSDRTLRGDLKIIVRTVPAVVLRRGAH